LPTSRCGPSTSEVPARQSPPGRTGVWRDWGLTRQVQHHRKVLGFFWHQVFCPPHAIRERKVLMAGSHGCLSRLLLWYFMGSFDPCRWPTSPRRSLQRQPFEGDDGVVEARPLLPKVNDHLLYVHSQSLCPPALSWQPKRSGTRAGAGRRRLPRIAMFVITSVALIFSCVVATCC
jgi:hypothetical protein